MTLQFRSDPSNFGAIRRLIAQIVILSGGSNEDAQELELAIGEILANAHQHAYRKTQGPLEIDVSYDDQNVEISIHDDGDVIVDMLDIPFTIADGHDHRGLYLVGKLTDHAEIVHPRNAHGGTTVRITKHIGKIRWLESILRMDANFGGQLLR